MNWIMLNAIKLTLNISKTEYMLITLKQKHNHLPYIPSPSIKGALIKKVSVATSLGCLLMEISLGIPIVDKVSKTIAASFGAIKRMKHFVPHSTPLTIFVSLVQPHFNFCNVVWGNCSKGLCDKLPKNQNRACPIIHLMILWFCKFAWNTPMEGCKTPAVIRSCSYGF